ncbi:MAG: AtpZ/AtpI family protein [Alphaproteobacteria bacterium]|nr:AtpZ/AtpI family protein [Alphaproteobacteria bacterium]
MTERDREPSGTPSDGGPSPPGKGLSQLKDRLAAARARDERSTGGKRDTDASGIGIAMRVGIELAGTLAVGVGIGWLLDRWLGTGPWLLVVFFFLGSAAGILNVYRAVKNIGLDPAYRREPDEAAGDEDKDESGGR